MAELSGFFNALESGGKYDRVYDSSDFAKYFAKFISNGVFASPVDQLKVISSDGLTVTVKKGDAFIDGYWYSLTEDMDIVLSPNETSYDKNIVICCTLNKTNREIRLNKKEGVSSILPTNNGTIHELVLASIVLGVGVGTISNAMITDRRMDETYCGIVKGMVEQIETGDLFLQYDSMFKAWFDSIKGQLGTDIAGNLQNQITAIVENTPVIRSGTEPPDNSVGKDGDIYIRVVE